MPQTHVVLIPCFQKPAFLHATLCYLERARGASSASYMFCIDRGADARIDNVIEGFDYAHHASIVRRKHNYVGSTFNVLEGLRSASQHLNPNTIVHVLEDDIFVSEDYFEFHEDAHAFDPVFVSAAKGWRFPTTISDANVYQSCYYRSHGVSFRAHTLQAIVEHAKPAYYKDMIGYIARELPDAALEVTDAEHTGLIHRVVRRSNTCGVYPVVPRAFHAGFVGYNRGEANDSFDFLPVEEASEQIRAMTTDQLNANSDPWYRDIERCDLIRPRVALQLI